MKVLIIKLGAAGDVVRTTTLLNVLESEIHWLTADNNLILLNGIKQIAKCIPWGTARILINENYDLIINLEDSVAVARLLDEINHKELFGAYLSRANKLTYTESSKAWFDLSIISRFGNKRADELKFENRKTYQEMIFDGLGYTFHGERYFLPNVPKTSLTGDVAIARESGSVWPMKNWAHYDELKDQLEENGYTVNFLPKRETLLEHIADIRNHKYLISGDSLPMHIALGNEIKCLTLFICTSPWEIYHYGVQRKMVSSRLDRYFYRRDFVPEAATSISLAEVYETLLDHMVGQG